MNGAYSLVVMLTLAFLAAATTTDAGRKQPPTRGNTLLGLFSLAAPKGWRLDAASKGGNGNHYLRDPDHAYYMRPVNRSKPLYIIEVRAESAASPEAAQTLEVMRLRSGVLDAREDEVRRSEVRSQSGNRIRKAVYGANYSSPSGRHVFSVRSVLYSFRGPDGRVYTLLCWPERNESAQDEALLDRVARSVKFSP